ncbi:fimbrial biogenesis chaperone [Paraburkholderia mimosarum]|uniref:fimbrial biogenesis chaperone n=1 Tax=Paraburkholderia mimosarum TaxID=312026 RepID=UPI001FC8C161|nr:molecular chaperone [Paraburkholderia mimosarum]
MSSKSVRSASAAAPSGFPVRSGSGSGPSAGHARVHARWRARALRVLTGWLPAQNVLHSIRLAGLALAHAALLAASLSLPAHAGVTPVASRVIFPAGDTEQSVQLFNVNKYPVLVQAWIDDGRIEAVPQESTAPFVTLPPIFRMGAGDQTSLRIIHSGAKLPSDRESLFWLNLYEIPGVPKNQPDQAQSVMVTMRTQYKVFVRPAGLPYGARELPKRLTFSLANAGGKLTLKIDNPTPYYATFNAVLVKIGGRSQQITPDMVAPLSGSTLELDPLGAGAGETAEVLFSLIDDDGNPMVESVKATIAP